MVLFMITRDKLGLGRCKDNIQTIPVKKKGFESTRN